MKCPNCDVDLLMAERAGEQIDYCPQCRGIWLEKGKLDKIIEKCGSQSPAARPDDKDSNKGGDRGRGNDDDRGGFLGNLLDF